jgi:ATP-dependent RNA helicase DeaD
MTGTPTGFPEHIHPALLDALRTRGFTEATPVQRAVLEEGRKGKDLLVSSQTGSGKTVAFGVAAADSLLASLDGAGHLPRARKHQPPKILVVAPTRELALQVERELEWLYAPLGARVASCVGGVDIHRERRALYGGVDVVVGTPGRLVDHLTRKSLDLSSVACVVLDEADEMLDMGFRDELEAILQACPPSPPEGARRTLLFSATLPKGIVELARKYQNDAERITATPAGGGHQDIDVKAHLVAPEEREHAVVNVLRFHDPARALVFVALRETVTRLQARLVERGFSAVALSGELSQAERTRALQALRDGRARVLVCTDVAARGLDLPEVSLVVHADVANDPVTMTHRNGRTGRAGRKGTAVVLAIPATQRTAEMQLLAVGSRASWTPLPSAPEVHSADRTRLLGRVAEELGQLDEDDRAVGEELLARHSAEDVAALLAHALRAALPQPEEVAASLALRPTRFSPKKKPFRQPGRFRDRDDRGPPRDHRGPPRDHRGPPRDRRFDRDGPPRRRGGPPPR